MSKDEIAAKVDELNLEVRIARRGLDVALESLSQAKAEAIRAERAWFEAKDALRNFDGGGHRGS